jgi:hypothetical protein
MNREPMMVHCGSCSHEWAPCFLPADVEIVARAAKHPCPACGSKDVLMGVVVRETPEGDYVAWLTNGDTGTSSLTIWHVMTGRGKPQNGASVPWDPSDFGRCHRLLELMPSWRARLPEMVTRYPSWAELVTQWDEITRLYLEELPSGKAPKCYALISRCVGRGEQR